MLRFLFALYGQMVLGLLDYSDAALEPQRDTSRSPGPKRHICRIWLAPVARHDEAMNILVVGSQSNHQELGIRGPLPSSPIKAITFRSWT